MFVSLPQYEFPVPPELASPGTQHWRLVELTVHAPWFLLSVDIMNVDDPEVCITRTLCIAWDNDLAEVLRSLDTASVRGVVCMVPAWQSATGQWSSRALSEVWLCKSAAGQSVLLRDTSGQEFDCGWMPEHSGEVTRDLLLRVKPSEHHR